jgi:CubicO group peptidase (beta-lactamase class C family)
VIVHGWDIAVASGQPFSCEPELLTAAYEWVQATVVRNPHGTAGLFGPPVAVPDDAPLLARLLGLTGRDPAWHAGGLEVPGMVALVACEDQVHVEVVGSLTIGGPAVQRDSLFRIASTTKPLTGAATLALVREGLLTVDQSVSPLLPELAAPRVLRRMDGSLADTVSAERQSRCATC